MKIIAERVKEMKGKGRKVKGGNKMKKIMIALVVTLILVSTSNAFAHWKAPEGLVLQDPAPCPFDSKKI